MSKTRKGSYDGMMWKSVAPQQILVRRSHNYEMIFSFAWRTSSNCHSETSWLISGAQRITRKVLFMMMNVVHRAVASSRLHKFSEPSHRVFHEWMIHHNAQYVQLLHAGVPCVSYTWWYSRCGGSMQIHLQPEMFVPRTEKGGGCEPEKPLILQHVACTIMHRQLNFSRSANKRVQYCLLSIDDYRKCSYSQIYMYIYLIQHIQYRDYCLSKMFFQ